ncbi:MAG TPA: hypothetical protein PK547_01235 [Candidatus Paceibacterota bacterium]|nr:hypothetical protein [Candidatus Paceibacterota bacterium]
MKTFFENFNQLISRAWERIKPRFKNIAYLLLLEMGIGLVAALLVGAIFVFNSGISFVSFMAQGHYNPEMLTSMLSTPRMGIAVVLAVVIGLAAMMLYSFVSLAFLIAIKEDAAVTLKEILNLSKKKYWAYFGTLFLSGVLIALASLAFVIPGIILAILYFAVPFIVIETSSINTTALKASQNLVKNHAWMVTDNLFVWMLLVGLASILLKWLGPVGQLLQMLVPIFNLAFNYELYLSLKAVSQTETPPTSTQPENPATPLESSNSAEA